MKNTAPVAHQEENSIKLVSSSEDIIPLENQKIFRFLMHSLNRMSRHVESTKQSPIEWTFSLRTHSTTIH